MEEEKQQVLQQIQQLINNSKNSPNQAPTRPNNLSLCQQLSKLKIKYKFNDINHMSKSDMANL